MYTNPFNAFIFGKGARLGESSFDDYPVVVALVAARRAPII
mgnify:CR=1 FL=1